MNRAIEAELDVLWSDEFDVDEKIEAFHRLKAVTKAGDIPRLVEALKSDKSDFWIRELLAEPICEIGGPEYLLPLFDALSRNYDDGHDNDGFAHFLMEMAEMQSEQCRPKLEALVSSENPKYREYASWLMEFCK